MSEKFTYQIPQTITEYCEINLFTHIKNLESK